MFLWGSPEFTLWDCPLHHKNVLWPFISLQRKQGANKLTFGEFLESVYWQYIGSAILRNLTEFIYSSTKYWFSSYYGDIGKYLTVHCYCGTWCIIYISRLLRLSSASPALTNPSPGHHPKTPSISGHKLNSGSSHPVLQRMWTTYSLSTEDQVWLHPPSPQPLNNSAHSSASSPALCSPGSDCHHSCSHLVIHHFLSTHHMPFMF